MVNHDLDECISKSYKSIDTGINDGISIDLMKSCLKSSIKMNQENVSLLAFIKEMNRKLFNLQQTY